jgi:hypothetical protein
MAGTASKLPCKVINCDFLFDSGFLYSVRLAFSTRTASHRIPRSINSIRMITADGVIMLDAQTNALAQADNHVALS